MEFKERKRILFLGLPWTFTVYTIKEDMLNTQRGFLRTIEDDCYMYKVQDVQLETGLLERMFKPSAGIEGIKDFILEASENARMKRRTLNTLNIGTDSIEDDELQ